MKHTPGPWETSKHQKLSEIHSPNYWTVKKHEFPYPPYEGELEDEYGVYPPIGEAGPVALVAGKANAHLIAAASEMYKALISFRDEGLNDATINKALNAIQKAEGK